MELQQLNIVNAKSGYKPTVSGFRRLQLVDNSRSARDLGNELDGWNAGAQVSWNIFDGC